jgi:hypothetical protein
MGDGKLLEEVISRNCQFLQVGRAETVSRLTRRASRTSSDASSQGINPDNGNHYSTPPFPTNTENMTDISAKTKSR